jgi:BirA family biotin operon repressor/biotin-[acetyl-CoA-carboxylase] ligase
MGQLKDEGYRIEAVRNRGYRLVEEADVITAAELTTMLHTEWLGKRLEYFEETDSTNIQARRLAEEGAPHGTLVVADCQTAGKGRRGRSWVSPHGTGIWMSFVLRPEFEPAYASMLTLVAGMAVAKGIRETTGLEALIKWPNDLVLGGKKICGILTEMSTEDESIRYVVPGIGINVNTEEFPEEIKNTATSLKLVLGKNVKRSPVIAASAAAFEEYYRVFVKTCDMSGLMEEYDRILANREKQVCVLDPKGEYQGLALGIDREGNLLVKREDGSIVPVFSGEVSVRGIYGYV